MSDETENQMPVSRTNTGKSFLWWIASVIGVSLLVNFGWHMWKGANAPGNAATASADRLPVAKEADNAQHKSESGPERVELSAEKLSRAGVETTVAVMREISERAEFPGRLHINQDTTARIGSFVEGRVTRVTVRVGDFVKAGQPVVYIHSHEVADARSQYAKSQAAIVSAEKSVALARIELDRARRLLEAKAISQREQQQAELHLLTAQSELDVARAEQHRTQEFLHHLGVSPEGEDDAKMVAPISGTVIRRDVTAGTVVTPATDLVMIANLSSLWAVAEVPEKQAAGIRSGQAVDLRIAAFPQSHFAARVVYIGETLSAETRTVQVRCLMQNPRGLLRPEMTATIGFRSAVSSPVLTVPRDTVTEMNGEKVVFLEIEKGRFEKRQVETGREQGEWMEIVNGLRDGDRVVTRGAFFIKSEFLKGTLSEE